MRRSAFTVLVAVASLAMANASLAQDPIVPLASSDRGPRFLMATPQETAALDVSRSPLLRRRVSIDVQRAPLRVVLDAIAKQAGFSLSFSPDVVNLETPVTLDAKNLTVAAALTEVLIDLRVDVVFSPSGQLSVVRQPTQPAVGTITGQVTDSSTKQVILGAKVSVRGTRLNTSTDAEGRFTIPHVPVGDRVVSVKFLSYAPATQSVRVVENEIATVLFLLTRAPTKLADIVTTATGERQRLEVGNAVGTIQADSIVPTTLIRNMSDLLQARVPGAVVTNTDGAVGAPSKIRLRGVSSIALNNDPIIILDGVRLNAQTTVAPLEPNVGSQQMLPRTGVVATTTPVLAPSRLDDIDPNTIESIDVLRGPSASSLYGSDAANGVIVIKTKKGKIGSWRTGLLGDIGRSAIPGRMPEIWRGWGHYNSGLLTDDCSLVIGLFATQEGGGCLQDSVTQYNPQNDPAMRTLGTGRARSLSGNLSGGSEQLQQFLSVRVSDNVGMAKMSEAEQHNIARLWSTSPPSWMVRPNTEQVIDGSSRTTIRVSSKSSLSLSATGTYRNVLNGGSGIQATYLGAGASPGDTLSFLPSESQRTKLTSLAKRGTLGVNADYRPWGWLTVAGNVGGDYTLRTDAADIRAQDCTVALQIVYYGTTTCPSGHTNNQGQTFVTTANVNAQLSFAPVSWMTLRTSLGEQYTHTNFYSLQAGNSCPLAFGTTLLTPQPVCAQWYESPFSVLENRDASATAGWYIEETAGLLGMYTTFGFREDVASAFGSATKKTPPKFPKLSLSYPVSEQSFFPKQSAISSLRLRLAYGQSGSQASQTAVLNNYTLNQLTFVGAPAAANVVVLSQAGNASLRPEKSTEWEGGFDMSFLENERLHAEVTLYRKFTRDAITSLALPPSYGQDVLSQFINLGNVENRGAELQLTARLLDAQQVGWDLTVNAARNTNKLVHKAPGLNANGPFNTQFREGYPLFGFWGVPVASYTDRNGNGILEQSEIKFGSLEFMGAPYPRSELTYTNSFSFFRGALRLNASLDQINGQTTQLLIRNTHFQPRGAVDRTAPLAEQAAWIQAVVNNDSYLGESTSLRFNELSVTYNVPQAVARRLLRTESAAITFAGRNLALWSNYAGKDPNIDTSGLFGEATQDNGLGVPQPRNWTFRFNLGF